MGDFCTKCKNILHLHLHPLKMAHAPIILIGYCARPWTFLISFHLWFLNVQLFLFHFMNFYLSKMAQFIQSSIFNKIQLFSYHLTRSYSKNGITDITDEYKRFIKSYITCKFILNVPIGSGKSTALMNHIKENTNKSYMLDWINCVIMDK